MHQTTIYNHVCLDSILVDSSEVSDLEELENNTSEDSAESMVSNKRFLEKDISYVRICQTP